MLASGMFTGQDQVPSRFATVTADLGNLIQQVISVLVFLAQSLSVEFRARLAAQTSFRGRIALQEVYACWMIFLADVVQTRFRKPLRRHL